MMIGYKTDQAIKSNLSVSRMRGGMKCLKPRKGKEAGKAKITKFSSAGLKKRIKRITSEL